MKERPILFSAPMVRALLAGTKTQTRRALNERHLWHFIEGQGDLGICPYGQPGDRLWVREACMSDPDRFTIYRADWERYNVCDTMRWRPSIHMPRWASRLTLTVTAVRVERLQEISCADAIAEGIAPAANSQTIDCDTPDPRDEFHALWDRLHGEGAWDANPEVVAITFAVRKGNIDDRRHP